jgi:hypothetical protein
MEPCATVVDVRVLDGYQLELTFADGLRGTLDLSPRILGRGGVFQALENPAFFRQVRVVSDLGTIVWPNEADICPDLLHAWVAAGAAPPLGLPTQSNAT